MEKYRATLCQIGTFKSNSNSHRRTIQKVTGHFGILSLRKDNVNVSKEGDIQGNYSKLMRLKGKMMRFKWIEERVSIPNWFD